MWPLSGLWTIFLTLALAELASVYPVSGAMASWAWKVARGGVGYERWWAWLMGGVVLGGHVASVSERPARRSRVAKTDIGIIGDLATGQYYSWSDGTGIRLYISTMARYTILPCEFSTPLLARDDQLISIQTVLLVCGLLGSQSWGRSHKFWMGAGMYGVSVWLILCVSLISAGAR